MKTLPLLAAFAVLLASAQAATMTAHMDWRGEGGYTANVKFNYNPAVPVVSGDFNSSLGRVEIIGISDLWVSINYPDGTPLVPTTQNIRNGNSTYFYLKFFFDTRTRDLVAGKAMDVGTPSTGWLYRSPTNGNFLVASELPSLAGLSPVDRGSNYSIAVRVPDSGSSALLMLAGLSGMAWLRRKFC